MLCISNLLAGDCDILVWWCIVESFASGWFTIMFVLFSTWIVHVQQLPKELCCHVYIAFCGGLLLSTKTVLVCASYAKCCLELSSLAAHIYASACCQAVIFFIHIQEWKVFCLHRLTLQCWHMSSSEFSVNLRLIVFFDAQVEHRQRWPLDSQEIAARSQQETSHSQQWIIWSGMLWFWRITLDMTRLVANAFGQYTIFTCFLLAVLSVPCNTGDRCTGGHFRGGYRDGWDKEQPELEIGGCFWRELTRWMWEQRGFSFCRIKRDQRAIFCRCCRPDLCWLRTNAAGANDVCVVVMFVWGLW